MGYVYAYRFGTEDLFKIGFTSRTPEQRKAPMQTASAHPLILFDAIETDDYKQGERHILDSWDHRRTNPPRGEVLRLTEVEAAAAFQHCRTYLDDEIPKARRVKELEEVEPDPTVLPRDDHATQLRLQWIELDQKEQELRLAIVRTSAKKIQVETDLKLAIGATSGIDGVAAWGWTKVTRRINPDLVKAADPELYERYLVPRFDATEFKAHNKDIYDSYQEIRRSREFKIAA